ncbi:hypothetical protein V1520DRAFT_390464 [Lipomyces starkeyi]|uniref:NAD-dependent epimerase/dehydratase domain-containing protein n=1 Tax=Lipomyces starkeyi NRRL Y-11557 TaxID=675824 RepID=A0A1E3QDQ6_LIPST|nr:hypothetical protein LIPSTDRAFT_103263 [Lipomyces starkeyi NRRL Y-11557]
MDSSKPLVLVTGVNGFIAARTAEAYLLANYNVRGTVRSIKSGKAILEALKEYVRAGRFEVVIVEDITVPGAFDEALVFKDPVPVLHGAINGTRTLLEAALNQGDQLKTVVLMSSTVAVMSPREPGHIYTEKDWNETAEDQVARLGAEARSIPIYSASKTAAERIFWRFRDEKEPAFTMTAVSSGAIVDVRDVARLLVFVVDHPDKTDGERYLAVSGVGTSQAMADILRKHYPERKSIIDEGTPGEGYRPDFDVSMVVDASKAVKLTGVPWIGYEDSVVAAAKEFEKYL